MAFRQRWRKERSKPFRLLRTSGALLHPRSGTFNSLQTGALTQAFQATCRYECKVPNTVAPVAEAVDPIIQRDADIARRALPGVLGNLGMVQFVLLSGTIFRDHPLVTSAFALVAMSGSLLRLFLVIRKNSIYSRSPRQWGIAFGVGLAASSAAWGLLCAFSIVNYGYFNWNSLFLRSEEHTSELQSPDHLVCRLLLEKKNYTHCDHAEIRWIPRFQTARQSHQLRRRATRPIPHFLPGSAQHFRRTNNSVDRLHVRTRK